MFNIYVVVSASPLSDSLPFSRFPVQSLIFALISLLYTPKSCATFFSTCSTARSARVGGGGMGGVQAYLDLYAFKSGERFNLPIRLPIPVTSPDPFPIGYWGSELRGLFVSRTSRQLWFNYLPTPVLATEVWPFSLP